MTENYNINKILSGILIKETPKYYLIRDLRVSSLKEYRISKKYQASLEEILSALEFIKKEPEPPIISSLPIDKERSLIVDSTGTSFIAKSNISQEINTKTWKKSLDKIIGNIPFIPSFIVIDMGYDCNLRCIYCSRRNKIYSYLPQTISQKILKKSTRFIAKIYYFLEIPIRIQPYGGEPIIYLDKIKKLISMLKEENVEHNIAIQTNATLITEEIAEELYSLDIGIGISIDGPKEIHNKTRGFFDRVIRGYENLITAGYKSRDIGVISVITKHNYRNIEEILDFFTENLNVSLISILLGIKTDIFKDIISPEDWVNVLTKAFHYMIKKDILISPISEIIESLKLGYSGSTCFNNLGCMGGFGMLAISTEGKVYSCPELIGIQEPLLNLSEDNLKNTKALIYNVINNAILLKAYLLKETNMMFPSVGHGCPLKNKIYTGSFSKMNPYDEMTAKRFLPLLVKKIKEEIQIIN